MSTHLSRLLIAALLTSTTLATIASNWTNPDAKSPTFSSTYLVGERIWLSWQPLNDSLNDLWLVRYDASGGDFTLRIATALDISAANSFPWTISLSEEEVLKDTRFEFVFVPQGSNYEKDATSDLESPGFNLAMVNQATPPNGTVGATSSAAVSTTLPSSFPTSAASSSTTTSFPSATPNEDSTLSYKETIGVAIGVLAAVGLAGFFGGYYLFKKRQARHNRASTITDVPMTGPYEVLGNVKGPVEVNGKETQVHEMNSSQDTLAHESDNTSIHEVGNTVKRPGLHEMPG